MPERQRAALGIIFWGLDFCPQWSPLPSLGEGCPGALAQTGPSQPLTVRDGAAFQGKSDLSDRIHLGQRRRLRRLALGFDRSLDQLDERPLDQGAGRRGHPRYRPLGTETRYHHADARRAGSGSGIILCKALGYGQGLLGLQFGRKET